MGEQTRFLVAEHKRNFKRGRGKNHPCMKLWYRGKEVLKKKVFNLTYEEIQGSIKKTRESITPIADTVNLGPSKYFIERS